MTTTEIELATQHPALPTKTEFDTMLQMANAICRAEFVPKGLRGRPDATLAAIMFGREIGLPPMVAMSSVYIIEGHPTMSAHLLMAMVRRAGHQIKVEVATDDRCELTGVRHDGQEMTVAFTIADAEKAGLKGKDNWKHYPADMLWARAVSRLYRRLFSDVAFGATVYVPEDFGATDAEASEVSAFTEAVVAELGVIMGLTEFLPKPEDGAPMGELVKKELLYKVMRDLNLPAWKECSDVQRKEAIRVSRDTLRSALSDLRIDWPENGKLSLSGEQAKDIFNLVRDGQMPVEEVTEAEIVDSGGPPADTEASTPQNGAVVEDAEVVEEVRHTEEGKQTLDRNALIDEALDEGRWKELYALLELDLSSGTNDQIETRTRKLYRLMGELKMWADDQLHQDLAPHAHYSDLGRKADLQAFAIKAMLKAKARLIDTEGDPFEV